MLISRAGSAAPVCSALQKRLWLGGSGVALFLLVLGVGNLFLPAERAVTRQMLGHDFLAFYTAGHFLRAGQGEAMYDLKAVRRFQRQVEQEAQLAGGGTAPYWNPPFYAWAFAPLSGWPYRVALGVWWAAGLMCLGGAIVLLCRMLPEGTTWRTWGLVPLLVVISPPALQAFVHGQNTFLSLLLLAGTVSLWRAAAGGGPVRWRGWTVPTALLAGMSAGLLLYKPQLGALVALVLVVSLGRRALLGVVLSGTALLLISLWTVPGGMEGFLGRVPGNLRWMQEQQYFWERHVTLKAFWRLLIQGQEPGGTWSVSGVLWGLSGVGLGSLLASAAYRFVRQRDPHYGSGPWRAPESRDALIAASIVCMPLLMPYYFDYDLLLMAVPAVLFARERLEEREGALSAGDRWLVRLWVAFYAVLYVSPALAGWTRVQVAVMLLAGIAGLQVARVYRRREVPMRPHHVTERPLAAAA